jgi:hypothetical protein
MMTLLDETARPTLRERIGRLLSECSRAEIAVGSIRLAVLDLTEQETRGVERCRILLGRLEARALSDLALSDANLEDQLRALLAFLESGRVEIRSAGLGAWSPDFSIYRGRAAASDGAGYRGRAPASGTCLVGAHYFREPPSPGGPAFTALLTDAHSIATALARFEALWERSHDVLEPVVSAVHRRQSFSAA